MLPLLRDYLLESFGYDVVRSVNYLSRSPIARNHPAKTLNITNSSVCVCVCTPAAECASHHHQVPMTSLRRLCSAHSAHTAVFGTWTDRRSGTCRLVSAESLRGSRMKRVSLESNIGTHMQCDER